VTHNAEHHRFTLCSATTRALRRSGRWEANAKSQSRRAAEESITKERASVSDSQRLRAFASDTVSKVIPQRRGRPSQRPAADVNNFAESKKICGEKDLRPSHNGSGRIALGGTRSSASHPKRISQSLSVRPAALVPTSERTKAHEAPGIR